MGVAVLTFAAFLLLTSYYLLKTVREPLILLQGGAEVKIYARAGQALLMAVFVHFLWGARALPGKDEAPGHRLSVLHFEPGRLRNLGGFASQDWFGVFPLGRSVQLHDRGAVLGVGRRPVQR